MARPGLLLLLLGLSACRSPQREVRVVVSAPPGVDLEGATWEPAGAVRRAERGPGSLTLLLDPGALPDVLALRASGACPVRVPLDGALPGDHREARLAPWIDPGPDLLQIGFDTAFDLRVTPGCREAVAGRITWRTVEGSLPELRVEQNGFRLRGRTARLADARPGPLPWGIVPLSPATRGAITLEGTWEGLGPTTRRVLRLSAAARATGVPTLGVGQRVVLGGEGFHVVERPAGGHAEVGAGAFAPDVGGRWVLEDARGERLALRAGRHADTPLDCGRSDCHQAAAQAAATTRMTTVLARELRGDFGPGHDPGCALACHAVGEPGLRDGGFVDVAHQLGDPPLPRGPEAWSALPRPLRRLGGVGCTACHGPGAIPERAARWTILRADVCATCHDAPPRYGHVAAWRATRMAQAGRARETRSGRCAGCHTTAGFLAALGARPASASEGGPDEPAGVDCAACHAPHAPATERALVRKVAPPEGVKDAGVANVCLRCHAPVAGEPLPSASAALLWAGGAHAAVKDGCVGCHAAGAAAVERGKGHAFAADRARCGGCHECPQEERPDPRGRRVAERAAALWEVLRRRGVVEGGGGTAPHADVKLRAAEGSAEARAAWAVLAVLEDRAAAAHDAAGARQRLAEAEKALGEAR